MGILEHSPNFIPPSYLLTSAPATLDTLLEISWLVSDQWIYQLELRGEAVNAENIRQGFSLIYQGFEPYFTADSLTEYWRVCRA